LIEIKKRSVIVIGAGPGGLGAAMILSNRGFDVKVFERDSVIGGRNAEVKLGPYRFDLGPTFLMMKFVLDELFSLGGRKIEQYLNCVQLDPMYRLLFSDKSLLVTSSKTDMKAEIKKAFPNESPKLDEFYERESKRFKFLYPCLQKNYNSLNSFLSLSLLRAFPHIAAGRSLYDVLSDYFQSEDLRLAFTFQSKYLGMSPWNCPGLFSMIPFVEHEYGIYHVMGGLSKISEAFAKVATENGAVIETSQSIKQVILKGRKVIGVELEDGRKEYADDVIINADFAHAAKNLFPPGSLKKYTPKKVDNFNFSCSTFMIYLGLDKVFDTDHHTIVFADDYKKNLSDISDYKVSEDFSVYIRNSSINDPEIAPAGHSALYILVPVPNNLSGYDWENKKQEFRDDVLDTIERRTSIKDIRKHIKEELVITPFDWEKKKSVYLGATFNIGHGLDQMLYFRPHNEFEEFSNCYLVGGGTHPGSGLPTIFESSRISSDLICKKYGIATEKPWSLEKVAKL
jgi:phytoene desaturase